jgi:hypothetical protein
MKKLLSLAVSALFSLTLFASDPVAVSEKVLQNFQNSFKAASDVSWYEYQDRFEVKFVYNEIDSRITYRKDGTVSRVIRYYGEAQLPLMLRSKLQKQFAGKKVFGVTEYATEGTMDYFIVLEDDTTWSHVRCSATGEAEVYQEYRKA